MPDRFQNHAGGLEAPASHAFAVTPSDAADLPETVRALYVGGAGALSVVMASGAEVVFANLAAASILPVRASRVKATGTSATQIVGLV